MVFASKVRNLTKSFLKSQIPSSSPGGGGGGGRIAVGIDWYITHQWYNTVQKNNIPQLTCLWKCLFLCLIFYFIC